MEVPTPPSSSNAAQAETGSPSLVVLDQYAFATPANDDRDPSP
jgi:hypothetical protein